jgi:hypothetical protein
VRTLRRTWVACFLLAAACRREALRVEPAASPAEPFAESADPVLAADPETGELLAGFVARGADSAWHLYFARSADRGASWGAPVRVTPTPDEIRPHGEASPRLVAAPGGKLALVWAQDYKVEGRKWPASRIRLSRSLDGGRSWSAPLTLNDDTTAAAPPRGHTFHGAAWVGDSGLVAVWLDERRLDAPAPHGASAHDHGSAAEGDATIYTVSSPDFGTTWTPNRPLWGATCPCCRVTVAREADGRAVAAWRKHFPGDVRDVVTAPLPIDGEPSLPEPARVHADEWVYPGCPHTGPALALAEDGTRHVAWYTGRPGGAGVYLARSGPAAPDQAPVALVSDSTLPVAHPAVQALPGNASLAAWDIAPGGKKRLSLAYVPAGATRVRPVTLPGADGAAHPQLLRLNEREAFLAWTGVSGNGQRIGAARVELTP